jgi:ABC-2 type transport system ATP-binding protein
MITVRDINKKFGKIIALKNLNLQVNKGTIHGLIGTESSGKSTILSILSTLVRPDSGVVVINDIPLDKGHQIRKIIGFVPATVHLPPEYTARGLISFAASLHGMHDTNRINRILKDMGLDTIADQSIDRFSPAMVKNVALAIAFVHDPDVLLLDEPMAGLDPVSQKRLKYLLLSSNKTVLITGQDLDTVDGLCNSVTILKNGSVMIDDELSSLRQKIGKAAIEIKVMDENQIQKLLFEFQKQGGKATSEGKSVYIKYNKESEIPDIIRTAANSAEIMDAKPVKLSTDDVFAKYNAKSK